MVRRGSWVQVPLRALGRQFDAEQTTIDQRAAPAGDARTQSGSSRRHHEGGRGLERGGAGSPGRGAPNPHQPLGRSAAPPGGAGDQCDGVAPAGSDRTPGGRRPASCEHRRKRLSQARGVAARPPLPHPLHRPDPFRRLRGVGRPLGPRTHLFPPAVLACRGGDRRLGALGRTGPPARRERRPGPSELPSRGRAGCARHRSHGGAGCLAADPPLLRALGLDQGPRSPRPRPGRCRGPVPPPPVRQRGPGLARALARAHYRRGPGSSAAGSSSAKRSPNSLARRSSSSRLARRASARSCSKLAPPVPR